jgi:putative peptide zinc metalloprotease protein
LVRNDDIALVRAHPGQITVQLAHGDGQVLPATLVAAVPQASTRLPSAALGEQAGGPLPLDPADTEGLTTREPLFQFDLRLPAGSSAHVGARGQVQFHHGQANAATLAMRFVRRAFLRHFER